MFGGSYEKKDMEFKPLPKGRYVCTLENAVIEQTNSGTNYLQMDFVILKGDYANRKIWHKIWFTEKAYDMAAQQLDNIGVFESIEKADSIEKFLSNAAEVVFKCVGNTMEVAVTGYNTYNDKTYENTFLTGLGDGDNAQDPSVTKPQVNESEELPF